MSRKILVPLDGSLAAKKAVSLAVEEARWRSAEVILLHSLSFPKDLMWLDKIPWPRDWPGLVREEAEDYLVQEQLRLRGLVPARIRLEVGDPAQVIVEVAQEEAVDLIVMATHGRTGPGRWILGGVAHKVVQRTTCPVLLVPVAKEDSMEASFSEFNF